MIVKIGTIEQNGRLIEFDFGQIIAILRLAIREWNLLYPTLTWAAMTSRKARTWGE